MASETINAPPIVSPSVVTIMTAMTATMASFIKSLKMVSTSLFVNSSLPTPPHLAAAFLSQ